MTTQQIIEEKLVGGFDLQHLQVINESGQHNVPDGSESHFKVVLVAEAFEGTRLIARHRLVNETLADELAVNIAGDLRIDEETNIKVADASFVFSMK